jgi:hypothetical protein
MSLTLPADYHGMIQHQRSGHYQLVRWWGDAETVTRGTTQLNRDARDCYELLVPVRGEMSLRQDDTTLTAGPSSMVLTSLGRAFDLRHGDGFSCLAMVVPRARLEPRLTGTARRAGFTLDAGYRGGLATARRRPGLVYPPVHPRQRARSRADRYPRGGWPGLVAATCAGATPARRYHRLRTDQGGASRPRQGAPAGHVLAAAEHHRDRAPLWLRGPQHVQQCLPPPVR